MNKILQLLISNQNAKREFSVKQSGREATIFVYDVIGEDYYGGVSAKTFAQSLASLDVDTIHLRINSPGGDVFDGVAMGQALLEHPAKVIAHIDGQAASAATRLSAAADEVEIAAGAFYMIHNAWTIAIGNAQDLTKTAKLLNDVDETIVNDYINKTGQDAQQIRDWMAATTWFNAQDAVKYKFADRLADSSNSTNAKNTWDLSAYDNVPESLLNKKPDPQIDEKVAALRAANERRLKLLESITP